MLAQMVQRMSRQSTSRGDLPVAAGAIRRQSTSRGDPPRSWRLAPSPSPSLSLSPSLPLPPSGRGAGDGGRGGEGRERGGGGMGGGRRGGATPSIPPNCRGAPSSIHSSITCRVRCPNPSIHQGGGGLPGDPKSQFTKNTPAPLPPLGGEGRSRPYPPTAGGRHARYIRPLHVGSGARTPQSKKGRGGPDLPIPPPPPPLPPWEGRGEAVNPPELRGGTAVVAGGVPRWLVVAGGAPR